MSTLCTTQRIGSYESGAKRLNKWLVLETNLIILKRVTRKWMDRPLRPSNTRLIIMFCVFEHFFWILWIFEIDFFWLIVCVFAWNGSQRRRHLSLCCQSVVSSSSRSQLRIRFTSEMWNPITVDKLANANVYPRLPVPALLPLPSEDIHRQNYRWLCRSLWLSDASEDSQRI